MADFIYRSVTTTKYTKGETFHVFMRETNVSLEWAGVIETLSPEPEAGVLAIKLRPHFKDLFVFQLYELSISHSISFVKSF